MISNLKKGKAFRYLSIYPYFKFERKEKGDIPPSIYLKKMA